MRRFPLKRMTAALLPLSFLWLCACCVFTCGQETAGADEHSVVSSSALPAGVTDESGCEEGCPLALRWEATSPERHELKDSLQAPPAALPAATAAAAPGRAACEWSRFRPPRAAPSLELLSTLRI